MERGKRDWLKDGGRERYQLTEVDMERRKRERLEDVGRERY